MAHSSGTGMISIIEGLKPSGSPVNELTNNADIARLNLFLPREPCCITMTCATLLLESPDVRLIVD